MNNDGDLESPGGQAEYSQSPRRLAELECHLQELQSDFRDLPGEVAAQSLRVDVSEAAFKNILADFQKVVAENGRQKNEIERLESVLVRERRQKMAAVCILQGGCPPRNSDGEDSERTTIDDLGL